VTLRIAEQVHLWTPEEVQEAAELAVKVADMAGLVEPDRSVLLPVIMEKLAGKQVFVEQAGIVPQGIIRAPGDGSG
jgi:hypothetical protein